MALSETMRKAIDELRADRARIDEALAALEQFAGGAELAAPAAETEAPHKVPEPVMRESAASQRGPKRVNWGTMPGFERWRRELMTEALALPPGKERGAAMERLSQMTHVIAGARRSVGKTTLYAWLKDLEGKQPKGKAKPPPPADDDDDEAPAKDPQTERERLQAAGAIGNPVELGRKYDDASRRKPDCPAYNGCLGYAVKRKWEAFACSACTGPGAQKRPGPVRRRGL